MNEPAGEELGWTPQQQTDFDDAAQLLMGVLGHKTMSR